MKKNITICFLLLSVYHLSASGAGESPEVIAGFNKAVELYESRKYDESLDSLSRLSGKSDVASPDELMLRSAVHYRIGQALADEGDTGGALMSLEKSEGFLKRILQLEPDNGIAANNLEVIMGLKERLREEQNRAQQQREENQSVRDDLEELKERQKDLSEDSAKDTDSHRESQEELNEQTEDLANRDKSGNSEFRDNMDKALEAQQKASEALENREYDQADQHQKKAVEYLEKAAGGLDGEEEGQQPESPSEEEQDDSDRQTDQLIQSIIDNENRSPENSDETDGGVAVERNW